MMNVPEMKSYPVFHFCYHSTVLLLSREAMVACFVCLFLFTIHFVQFSCSTVLVPPLLMDINAVYVVFAAGLGHTLTTLMKLLK